MTKKPSKKKIKKEHKPKDRTAGKKSNKIKAIILFVVALFFFAYMIYSGGNIGSFFALVIGLVCGLMGIITLREGKKRSRK
jgi:Flp pilus assembly protein TadB